MQQLNTATLPIRRRNLAITRVKSTVAIALAGFTLAACVPFALPPEPTVISPSDNAGYVDPIISGDGQVVAYRRETDQYLPPLAARELVVTDLGSNETRRFSGVGVIEAIAEDGGHLVHWRREGGESSLLELNTTTGLDRTLVADRFELGGDTSAVRIAMAHGTIAWLREVTDEGNCPCHTELQAWRNDEIITNLSFETFDSYDDYIEGDTVQLAGLSPDGEVAYLFDTETRAVSSVSLNDGMTTRLVMTLPTAQRWEVLRVTNQPGPRFVLSGVDSVWTVAAGAEPTALTAPRATDRQFALSPNGRFAAFHGSSSTEILGDQRLYSRSYSVTDLERGSTVVVAQSVFSEGQPHVAAFSALASVSDFGVVAIGRWKPGPNGTWRPSVIEVLNAS